MKTFIAALIIFALLFSLVLGSAFFVRKEASALLSLARALPDDGKGFESGGRTAEKALTLLRAWQESKRRFSYIMGRDIIDKADEAAHAIYAAAKAESADNFLPARLRFISLMERITLIFSLSAESIL